MSNTAIKKLYLPFWYVSCTFTLAKGLIDFYSLPPYALLSYVVLSTDTQRAPQKRRSEQLAPGSGPLPFYSLCPRVGLGVYQKARPDSIEYFLLIIINKKKIDIYRGGIVSIPKTANVSCRKGISGRRKTGGQV